MIQLLLQAMICFSEKAKQKQADLIHHVQMNESQLQNIEKENQTVIQSMESIKEEIEKIREQIQNLE